MWIATDKKLSTLNLFIILYIFFVLCQIALVLLWLLTMIMVVTLVDSSSVSVNRKRNKKSLYRCHLWCCCVLILSIFCIPSTNGFLLWDWKYLRRALQLPPIPPSSDTAGRSYRQISMAALRGAWLGNETSENGKFREDNNLSAGFYDFPFLSVACYALCKQWKSINLHLNLKEKRREANV